MLTSCSARPSPLQLHPSPLTRCLARALAPLHTPAHNTRTPHENRYYASWQGGTSAQSRRTHLGCMGVRGCEGSCAGHGRQAGQWLTCARPAAKRQIVRLLEEVVHSLAYLQQGRAGLRACSSLATGVSSASSALAASPCAFALPAFLCALARRSFSSSRMPSAIWHWRVLHAHFPT